MTKNCGLKRIKEMNCEKINRRSNYFLLSIIVFMWIVLFWTIEVKASNNITISGVNVGYSDGSYFSKNGSACKCHERGTCGQASDCNCIVISGTSQCYGWSMWIENKLFGYNEISKPSNFTTVVTNYSNCTGSGIYNKLNGKIGAGTHIRTLSSKKGYSHSVSVISYNQNGIDITDCNYSGKCQVDVRHYTWDSFAKFMNEYGGISFVKAYKNVTTDNIPQGSFDGVAGGEGTVTVSGWAFDRDDLSKALSIHVYVGGAAGTGAPCYPIKADKERKDVEKDYPGVGNYHGFSETLSVNQTGTQEIYVYAINEGGTYHPLLGHKTVTIKAKKRPQVKVWFSSTKMGEKITSYETGNMCYLCYEIIDGNTGKILEGIDNANISVTETIYKPGGSVAHTYTYNNGNNWIGCKVSEKGTYRGNVTITGDYTGSLSVEFEAIHTHSYTEKVTKAATCTNTGVKKYTCSCGDSYTKTISKKVHTIQKDAAVAATCTANGHTEKSYCSVCGTVITASKTIPATGHTWDLGKVTKQATATENGIKIYTCTKCNKTKTTTIPRSARPQLKAWFSTSKMGEEMSSCEKGTTSYLCYEIIDGNTGKALKDIDDMDISVTETIYNPDGSVVCTYTAKYFNNWIGCRVRKEGTYTGVVKITGDLSGTLKMTFTVNHTHKYTEEVTRAATCTTAGVKKYICSCGDSYTKTISPKAHTIQKNAAAAATCTANGHTEGSYCSVCGTVITASKKIPATGHTWDLGKVTKQATATENGVKTYVCTKCKKVKTETIEALGSTEESENTENLLVGDFVKDSEKKALYEVVSVDGNEINVAYKKPLNTKTRSVNIPSSIKTEDGMKCNVTAIAGGAFKNNKNVKKIVVGKNVNVIGAQAFAGCKNLTSITLGVNVSRIETKAFYNCKKLQNLVLPSGVSRIDAYAFSGCKKLKTLTIKTKRLTAKSINAKTFKNVSANVKIEVPKGKVKTYQALFRKSGLNKKVKVTQIKNK